MGIEEKEKYVGFTVTGAALGAAAGFVVGAAVGLLFAHKSGQETREKLGDWLKDQRDKGQEILNKIKEEGLHKKHQVSAAIKAGREAYVETVQN